ncbi:SAM-dependent methyltransferase [Pedobacter sp. UYP24]
MSNQSILDQFKFNLILIISSNELLKVSLGNYKGNDITLKNIYVKKVKIKRLDMLSFTYRHKTRDIVKNWKIEIGINLILKLVSNDFRVCSIFSTNREVTLEQNIRGIFSLKERLKSEIDPLPSLNHDHEKKRQISVNNIYLNALKVTDGAGNVYKATQDKYKQINQYIEILSPLLRDLSSDKTTNVVDMGSGKGYLTFALYDYLHTVLGFNTIVTGVEFRDDLVVLCNGIAQEAGFRNLNFVQGSIQEFESVSMDILIALHACDTATDDAIYKGIIANANLIVVAPCCHKQIRREMEKSTVTNELSFLTKHGIFLERQAEMVTDGLRALVLQYFGYKTKVIEFVSNVHTPKNVLIIGIKKDTQSQEKKKQILAEIKQTMIFFGIGEHYLLRLLNL